MRNHANKVRQKKEKKWKPKNQNRFIHICQALAVKSKNNAIKFECFLDVENRNTGGKGFGSGAFLHSMILDTVLIASLYESK